jgi:tRNA 2-thiouridine synthesizing protein A
MTPLAASISINDAEPFMLYKRDSSTPPRANDRVVAQTRPLGPAGSEAPHAGTALPRILILEKDKLVASSLLGMLDRYELELATSVAAAVEWLSRETFEVVLASEVVDGPGRLAFVDNLERAMSQAEGPRPRLYLYTQEALGGVERLGWVERLSLLWSPEVFIGHLAERSAALALQVPVAVDHPPCGDTLASLSGSASGEAVLDCRGLSCPTPIVRVSRAARSAGPAGLRVFADDPAFEGDLRAWCLASGHKLERIEPHGDGVVAHVGRVEA